MKTDDLVCKIQLSDLFPLEEFFHPYPLAVASGQVPESDEYSLPIYPRLSLPSQGPLFLGFGNIFSFSRHSTPPLQSLILLSPQDQDLY